MLSRAFRNRFVELHFDDIPPDELVTILYKRCQLPESYAKKLVAVMRELQVCACLCVVYVCAWVGACVGACMCPCVA